MDKIEELERKKTEYLEVDDKKSARRIENQINKLQLKEDLKNMSALKRELEAYKEVLKNYPELKRRVENAKNQK